MAWCAGCSCSLPCTTGPRDFSLTLLAPRAGSDWSWVRWLPQARPVDADVAIANIGSDPDTINSRVSDLAAQVKARKELAKSGPRSTGTRSPPWSSYSRGHGPCGRSPGMAQVLTDGPDVGIIAICTEAEERLLPEECTATIVLDPEDPCAHHRAAQRARTPSVTSSWSRYPRPS